MTDQKYYEVIVVGGGLTGVMMALALSYSGYGPATAPAIALVDRAQHTPNRQIPNQQTSKQRPP